MKLEQLAAGLRRLRRHLDAMGNVHPVRWSAVLDRYDRLLLDAGQMLEVPVPPMACGPRLLADEARAELERALATAGLHIRVRPMLEGTAG